MNNNVAEVEDERDISSADDIIDVTSNESSKLNNQAGNSESESTPKADRSENDKTEKINVYEQVASMVVPRYRQLTFFFPDCAAKRNHCDGKGSTRSTRSHNNHFGVPVLLDALFLSCSLFDNLQLRLQHSKLYFSVVGLFQQLIKSHPLQHLQPRIPLRVQENSSWTKPSKFLLQAPKVINSLCRL